MAELFRFVEEDFVDTADLFADDAKAKESSLLERIKIMCN